MISVSPDTVTYDPVYGSLDTASTITAGACTNSSHIYDYYGNYGNADSIVLTDSALFDVPHYKLRLIFWAIMIDNWSNGDLINVDVNTVTQLSQQRSTKIVTSKICKNNGNDED